VIEELEYARQDWGNHAPMVGIRLLVFNPEAAFFHPGQHPFSFERLAC